MHPVPRMSKSANSPSKPSLVLHAVQLVTMSEHREGLLNVTGLVFNNFVSKLAMDNPTTHAQSNKSPGKP